MTNLRGVTALATAALLLVAVTSCGKSGNGPASSGSPSPSLSAPVTATTAAPPPDSKVASEAASAIVAKYYGTVDRLGQQPSAPLSDLSTVAAGVQVSAEQHLLRSQRKAGEKQTGDTRVAKIEIQSVNLDNSDPATGKVPTVQVDVCWDVSKVDVVDANGQSIVSPSRPDTGWTRLTVANYHYAADPIGGWRVATGQDLKREPCASS